MKFCPLKSFILYSSFQKLFLCGFLAGRPISSNCLLKVESDMDTPDSTKPADRSLLHFVVLFLSCFWATLLFHNAYNTELAYLEALGYLLHRLIWMFMELNNLRTLLCYIHFYFTCWKKIIKLVLKSEAVTEKT